MTESQHITLFGDVPAMRYGNKYGEWDEDAPIRLAAFVLGYDVDSRTTALNEQAYDVITPVKEFWRPEEGVADLEVSDQQAGVRIIVGLGDWVAKLPAGRLRAFTNNRMIQGSFPLTQARRPSVPFESELQRLIIKESYTHSPQDVLNRYLAVIPRAFDLAPKGTSDANKAANSPKV